MVMASDVRMRSTAARAPDTRRAGKGRQHERAGVKGQLSVQSMSGRPASAAPSACCGACAGIAEGPMRWTRSRALSAAAATCRQGQAALRASRQLPGAGCMSRDLACTMQPGQPGACARRDRRLRDARCVLASTSAWLPRLHAACKCTAHAPAAPGCKHTAG